MDKPVMLLCKFGPYTAVRKMSPDLSFADLVQFVCMRWMSLKAENVSFVYSLPGHPNCMLDDDNDFDNMLILVQTRGVNFVDVTVKHDSNVDNNNDEGSSVNQVVDALLEFQRRDDAERDLVKFNAHQEKALLCAGWVDGISHVGQAFEGGATEFRNVLCKYAIEVGFQFHYLKNDNERVTAECKMKKSKGCLWRVHASVERSNKFFYIKTLNNNHSCGAVFRTSKNPRMSSDVVANILVDQVRDRPLTRPIDVIRDFKENYGMDIGYHTAWSGVEKAKKRVYGDHSTSFDELRWYFEQVKIMNPGSRLEIDYDQETGVFNRCFVAFHACIFGFNFCRPLLFLDVTFLKGRYKGSLLAATAKDGDQGLFQVAFAIVRSEDEDNWTWFLQQLVQVLGEGRIITFISNRNLGLLEAVRKIFPTAYHAYCLHQIEENLKEKLKGTSNAFRESIVYKLRECAYAPNEELFHKKLEELKLEGGSKLENFLEDLPFENWTNVYFKGRRYGEMWSNSVEFFNTQIRECRHLPITNMIDSIRLKLMNQMFERSVAAMEWKGSICPEMEKRFQEALKESRIWTVSISSEHIFEVHSYPSMVVDVARWRCSCGQWQLNGFPCSHAVAAIHKNSEDPYSFIDPHFHVYTFRECYSKSIYPVPTFGKPNFSLEEAMILPPQRKKQPEKSKKKRIPSQE